VAETKYGKHIMREGLIKDLPDYTGYSLLAHEGELNVDCSIGYHCITKPTSFDRPHAHDFTELLCFIGGNPTDIRDLGAEVEVCLGEEGEKHIIDTASVVSIPAGLVHCPISIKKVEKPIVFLEISLTRKYGSEVAKTQKE
jgi:hypothetical protein